MGWVVVVPYFILVKPLIALVSPRLLETAFPLGLTSAIVYSFMDLYAFSTLATQFPFPLGMFALLSFGFTPLVALTQGHPQADRLALFYWALVLKFLLKPVTVKRFTMGRGMLTGGKINIILATLAGILGALSKENEAVAFGIALFLLAITRRYHGGNRPYWWMWFGETVGTLTALAVSWILVTRQHDWYWGLQGHRNIGYMWEKYGSQTNFTMVWNYLTYMGESAFIGAVVYFVCGLLLGKKMNPSYNAQGRLIVWCLTMCLTGHLMTVAVGRYIVAMAHEWSRQLIVFSYLFTFWLFGMIQVMRSALAEKQAVETK